MNEKITIEHLKRGAIVYVRQSNMTQVIEHTEGRRRQYALAKRAEALGFKMVTIIDEDLGRSGSGLVARPGFEKLVSSVCTGNVGAVFSLEASRLSRNGKDWHHLIDLCGLVNTLLIDHDGVYDPSLINDRLLLGLKGSMSEFELSLFRQRSKEAIDAKARRGELRFCLPAGLCWTEDGKIELDPDRRVQHAVKMVFEKFVELCSVRQVLMWFREEGLSVPRIKDNKNSTPIREIIWRPAYYNALLKIIRNPFYAGAYAFGRTEARTRVEDGKARRDHGHQKPRERWTVLETSDMRVKQRIVRLMLEEVIVDIDEQAAQIAMKLHWLGGRHSELHIQRPRPGNHRHATRTDAVEIVKRMAGQWPDKEIAATLNRRGMKTGVGNTWTESRVYSLRRKHRCLDYSPPSNGEEMLTLNQAADRLGVGSWVVRRLIKLGILEASQTVRSAPWQIKTSTVESEKIRKAAQAVKSRKLRPGSGTTDDRNLTIPGT